MAYVSDEDFDRISKRAVRMEKKRSRDVRGRIARRRDRVDYNLTVLLCIACVIIITLGLLRLGHEISFYTH